MRRLCLVPALLVVILGCGRPSAPSNAAQAAAPATDTLPADRHVLDLNDGTEVWLIAGRSSTSALGTACRERGVELRKGGRSLTVPLLYTIDDPVMLNGKLVASLATRCVSGPTYTIDGATGQPTLLPRAPR